MAAGNTEMLDVVIKEYLAIAGNTDREILAGHLDNTPGFRDFTHTVIVALSRMSSLIVTLNDKEYREMLPDALEYFYYHKDWRVLHQMCVFMLKDGSSTYIEAVADDEEMQEKLIKRRDKRVKQFFTDVSAASEMSAKQATPAKSAKPTKPTKPTKPAKPVKKSVV